jgi:hypothetical protein
MLARKLSYSIPLRIISMCPLHPLEIVLSCEDIRAGGDSGGIVGMWIGEAYRAQEICLLTGSLLR